MQNASQPAAASGLARALGWLASTLGSGGLLAAAIGPLVIHAGVASPFVGFRIFGLGLLLGIPALVLGLLGLFVSRPPANAEARSSARTGVFAGALLVALLAVLGGRGAGAPMIHDITTDPANPPAFSAAAREADNQGRDMAYPPENAAIQGQAYPEVKPIVLAASREEAFARAQRTATALGWQIAFADPASGSFEATYTSAVFKFVDDVVVRVQETSPGESRIDLRSRSRVGRSDLGANAARIRAFAKKLGS